MRLERDRSDPHSLYSCHQLSERSFPASAETAAPAPAVAAAAPDLALPTATPSDLQPAPAPGAGQPRVQPVEARWARLHVDHVPQ